MLKDGPDLICGIWRKVDLVWLKNRDNTGVQFLGEVEVHITQSDDDTCPGSRVLFMETKERVEGIVEDLVRQEIVGIVKADHDDDVPFDYALAYVMQDLPEGDAGRRWEVTEELQVNFREHREPAPFILAVHIDRNESPGCLIYLGKDAVHTGRLPGAWEATEDSVQWPGSVESGT